MRTLVREEKSDCIRVKSGIPQGSVQEPIMFLVYINDMPEGMNCYMSLLANNAKLIRKVKNEDCEELERDLDRSYRWGMEFSAIKCHIMEIGASKIRPKKHIGWVERR